VLLVDYGSPDFWVAVREDWLETRSSGTGCVASPTCWTI